MISLTWSSRTGNLTHCDRNYNVLYFVGAWLTWVIRLHETSLHLYQMYLYLKNTPNPDDSTFKTENYINGPVILCFFDQLRCVIRNTFDSVTVTIVKEKLAAILNTIWKWLKIVQVRDLPSNES